MALTLALTMVACGSEEIEVDESLRSAPGTEFTLTETDAGTKNVVGHGITLEVPGDWQGVPEVESPDETTWEWAVEQPTGEPVIAYVQFSMGKKAGVGAPFESLPTATRELGEINPDFKLLDEGRIDVPGAERAAMLRFERSLETQQGGTVRVEQLQVFLDMPSGQTSVLRFIAPEGEWEVLLGDVYQSLIVAEGEPA